MIDRILDIFFPPKCPFCKEVLENKIPVCPDCMKKLPFTQEDEQCSICGRPLEEFSYYTCASCRGQKMYFEHSFTPLIYKDIAKEGVIALKTSHPYYAKAFAYLLADRMLSSEYYTSFDCITFVPQSSRSLKKRGYNQAKLIADELAKILKVPCIPTLIRTNDGKEQHTLSAAQRRENVKKCYFKTETVGKGTVLLVDDIYTTGATANYCSKLLKKMGFKKVYLAVALIRDDD
ncbi:MAG: ComF family protein [Ruminococcaceae bacterium]|nr:ComF family protein [Oscillospiraceae bacterium]